MCARGRGAGRRSRRRTWSEGSFTSSPRGSTKNERLRPSRPMKRPSSKMTLSRGVGAFSPRLETISSDCATAMANKRSGRLFPTHDGPGGIGVECPLRTYKDHRLKVYPGHSSRGDRSIGRRPGSSYGDSACSPHRYRSGIHSDSTPRPKTTKYFARVAFEGH
jgi:hypothetical protein